MLFSFSLRIGELHMTITENRGNLSKIKSYRYHKNYLDISMILQLFEESIHDSQHFLSTWIWDLGWNNQLVQ